MKCFDIDWDSVVIALANDPDGFQPVESELLRVERKRAFRDVGAVAVTNSQPSKRILELATSMFYPGVQAHCVNKKISDKFIWFCRLLRAAAKAGLSGRNVMISRNNNKVPRIFLDVVDAACRAGLFSECRSKSGASPHQTRLIPTGALRNAISPDPFEYERPPSYFVQLRKRKDKNERKKSKVSIKLPVNKADPVALATHAELKRINNVVMQSYIGYGGKRLRPVFKAVFTHDQQKNLGPFELHGRLYAGPYGHQHLNSNERSNITFDGVPSFEADFRSMHISMIYDLAGVPRKADPYELWKNTTPEHRLLAKRVVNALINAEKEDDAVSSCNQAHSTYTETGERRTRRALAKARKLRAALNATGLKFKQVADLALSVHAPVRRYLLNDMGMKLMRLDSKIALEVMDHFAKKSVPILSCHDSFVVPRPYAGELVDIMRETYRRHLGRYPEIKHPPLPDEKMTKSSISVIIHLYSLSLPILWGTLTKRISHQEALSHTETLE